MWVIHLKKQKQKNSVIVKKNPVGVLISFAKVQIYFFWSFQRMISYGEELFH